MDVLASGDLKMRLLLLLMLLQSCVTQPLSTDTIYRKDMQIRANGEMFYGVNVLDAKDKYDLAFFWPSNPKKLFFTSCHRQIEWTDPGTWIDRWKIYEYKPDQDLEMKGYCPVEVFYTDVNGNNCWGMIEFRTGREKLPAKLACNGESKDVNGVSACQAKVGLMQKITFPAAATSAVSEGCSVLKTDDGKSFLFEMSRGKCLYVFKSGGEIHRLVTFGYDDVILRG